MINFGFSSDRIGVGIEKGINYLIKTQEKNGSWKNYISTNENFLNKNPEQNIFSTIVTLQNLNQVTSLNNESFNNLKKRGRNFLSSEMETGQYWAFDGKSHHYQKDNRFLNLFEPDRKMVPDSYTTVLGNLVIRPSKKEKANIIAQIERYKDKSGMYFTYFEDFYGNKGYNPEPKNYISIGANLSILQFFSAYGINTKGLVQGILNALDNKNYIMEEVYHNTPYIYLYYASNALEFGDRNAKVILDKLISKTEILGNPEKLPKTNKFKILNNIDLASYIKAHSHLCLLNKNKCSFLTEAVAELLSRQSIDGNWSPSPLVTFKMSGEDKVGFYLPSIRGISIQTKENLQKSLRGKIEKTIYFFGSDADTTSFCIGALEMYNKLKKS